MNIEKCKKVLKGCFDENDNLACIDKDKSKNPATYEFERSLWTLEQLKAIVWWIENEKPFMTTNFVPDGSINISRIKDTHDRWLTPSGKIVFGKKRDL